MLRITQFQTNISQALLIIMDVNLSPILASSLCLSQTLEVRESHARVSKRVSVVSYSVS